MAIFPVEGAFWVGIILGGLHQLMLLYGGVQDWVLSPDRSTLLAMNKEGIVSLMGYLSLSLLAVALGMDIFAGTAFRRGRMGMVAALYYFLVQFGVQPSRRLANLPFVLGCWLLGTMQTQLLYREQNRMAPGVPMILEAVSMNQLTYFLVGNLLTGAINMSCYTLLQPPLKTISILVGYMALLSVLTIGLYNHGIRIKL